MSSSHPLRPRRIVIGANAHAELAALIRAARPELELRGNRYTEVTTDDLAWADTYLGFRRPLTGSMGNVRWVHSTGAGVDPWVLPTPPDEPLPESILLTRSSESFGPPIAEWALSRALAFSQRLLEVHAQQANARWEQLEPTRIEGSRVLVVGVGDIGSHVARRFTALGAHVTGVSRRGTARPGDEASFARVARVDALPTLVGDADWIVLVIPLTAESRGLVSRELLSRCRGAVLLNAGRGAVIDERALPEALDAGWLRGAALDVFETEPLPASSPLWRHPRVMVSPHISGLTTNEGAVHGFLTTLAEIEAGTTPTWKVERDRGY